MELRSVLEIADEDEDNLTFALPFDTAARPALPALLLPPVTPPLTAMAFVGAAPLPAWKRRPVLALGVVGIAVVAIMLVVGAALGARSSETATRVEEPGSATLTASNVDPLPSMSRPGASRPVSATTSLTMSTSAPQAPAVPLVDVNSLPSVAPRSARR